MSEINASPIHASPVAEGVRIQIGTATAFAVRRENKDISLRIRREYHTARDTMERIPFLRGIVRLVSGTADFLDGVAESAQLDPQQIVKGTRFEQRFAELFRVRPTNLVAAGSALAIIILLVGLVLVGPWALARYALPEFELPRPAINAIVCAARVLGGLVCAALIPRLRIINRLCMYRGAINKTLNAAGPEGRVSRGDAEGASRLSHRSDAAFVVTVLLLSIIAFALVRTFTLPVQLLVRVLIVLIIAAIVNEPIRLLEDAWPNRVAAVLLAPQLGLERLFVREPHPQMVEAAVCAYHAARENDR
ncbi:MAG: DUF1385 domain-containing protein [Clostridia bacterium]|nr:DUF1385 domain-containing protein [Clostridia bacterium]